MVLKLAEAGESDNDYVQLIKFICGEENKLSKDSEYADCKALIPFLSVETLDGGQMLVVRDGHEVLVPEAARKNLVDTMHFTHLSTDGMLRMSKGSFFLASYQDSVE